MLKNILFYTLISLSLISVSFSIQAKTTIAEELDLIESLIDGYDQSLLPVKTPKPENKNLDEELKEALIKSGTFFLETSQKGLRAIYLKKEKFSQSELERYYLLKKRLNRLLKKHKPVFIKG